MPTYRSEDLTLGFPIEAFYTESVVYQPTKATAAAAALAVLSVEAPIMTRSARFRAYLRRFFMGKDKDPAFQARHTFAGGDAGRSARRQQLMS
jgi:hypothetical protein